MVMEKLPPVFSSTCFFTSSKPEVLARGLPQVASFQATFGPSTRSWPRDGLETHNASNEASSVRPIMSASSGLGHFLWSLLLVRQATATKVQVSAAGCLRGVQHELQQILARQPCRLAL